MKTNTLKETASAGSTSAGSIAVDMSGTSKGKNSDYSLKSFIDSWQKKIKNKFAPYTITVTENFDIESVFSRLAGMERKGLNRNRSIGTTFGVEDDNGNLMKVTVDRSQADAFEQEVAEYLADIKKTATNFPDPESGESVSMAELLFKLKGKFNIIDVEFPEIPKDVVYNVKDATPSDDVSSEFSPTEFSDDEQETNPMDDSDSVNDPNAPMDLRDYKEPKDDEENQFPDIEDDELDISTEFPEDEPDTEGSILNRVIDMLKAQAESEIEKAKADAEKARAEQARYTAQATQSALRDQEDRLKYEIEIENEKKREKESKVLADMAKRKFSQTMSTVKEADEGMKPGMVMRQRQQIALRYQADADDTPETRQYKAKQKAEAMREWMSRYRQAINADRHEKQLKQKEREEQTKQKQQDNRQDQSNQQDFENEV